MFLRDVSRNSRSKADLVHGGSSQNSREHFAVVAKLGQTTSLLAESRRLRLHPQQRAVRDPLMAVSMHPDKTF
jgi:hypothetical protein